MMNYKHANILFKTYNDLNQSNDWIYLNFQQNFNARNQRMHLFDKSNTKVGKNLIVNRIKLLNDLIEFDWLNL